MQDVLQRLAQCSDLRLGEFGAQARRMNIRAPEAFIGIDITHTAQDALVQEKRFDSRMARANPSIEFFGSDF